MPSHQLPDAAPRTGDWPLPSVAPRRAARTHSGPAKFVALSKERKLLVTEAVGWLLIARAAMLFLPFSRICRYLGTLHPPNAPAAASPATLSQTEAVRGVRWAVSRAAMVLPVPMVCLPQALAGWQMLHRRGVPARLHFGARRSGDRMVTHAWLDAGGLEVTGYPVAHDFVEIGFYAR